MKIDCIHFKQSCSGCSETDEPPVYSEAKSFFEKEFHLPLQLTLGEWIHWRSRAKLAVRGKKGLPLIGLYKEGTHDVLHIPHCQVHVPLLNEGARKVFEWMIKERVVPYDESSGELRYIQLTQDEKSGLELILVVNETINHKLPTLLEDPIWSSVWYNFNDSKTNAILGPTWRHLKGPERLFLNLRGHRFAFHPACFMQANPKLFEELLKRTEEKIFKNKRVVEYFAGIGVFGILMAKSSSHVTLVEINPFSSSCFRESSPPVNTTFYQADAEALLNLVDSHEVVILDPPRKGAGRKLIRAIEKSATIEQVIYVSCHFHSFKEEALQLKKAGFKMTYAEAFLFFPGTNHIETLAIFER